MKKRRILFLGETYRADAITWMNGIKEFGDFEIVTWELKSNNIGICRLTRILELFITFFTFKQKMKQFNADMVIAERTTSYGFLAAISGIKTIAIAQQGITDLWPLDSTTYYLKKMLRSYALKKATLVHAWGAVMVLSIKETKIDMNKVMVLPKGINMEAFNYIDHSQDTQINAIVTRSLLPEYKHDIILKAFAILNQKNIPFQLTIVGDGELLETLTVQAKKLCIDHQVKFTGRIPNNVLPEYLQKANIYVSMPNTEGVSASLFEAMSCGLYPVVTDLPGNQDWITHKQNGILVPVDDHVLLADAIEWAFKNVAERQKTTVFNREMVQEKANYKINMKKIATLYHELIDKSEIKIVS